METKNIPKLSNHLMVIILLFSSTEELLEFQKLCKQIYLQIVPISMIEKNVRFKN